MFGDFVCVGKICYYGFLDMFVWLVMKVVMIVLEWCILGLIVMQFEYLLVVCDIEVEYVLVVCEGGMGIMLWSLFVGGFLLGKYCCEDISGIGWLSGVNLFGDSKFFDWNWVIFDVLKVVVVEFDCLLVQVVFVWVMVWLGVVLILVGVSMLVQLESNIVVIEIVFSDDQMQCLNVISVLFVMFSVVFVMLQICCMIFGGWDVIGWGE